ncbi:hypothetical protein AAur_pTC10127 (plasmid) [Paenarthrobacter aurescens TC1]|uniref:Uncharacterized protein n=2 Tax=Paenarthrobacter aurescens TaxID=43663 RepID=Q6SK37_PAEAU|nr:hypothetical protein [Paenarthrobacter aurescens]ABM10441.1 hypothetical protein AAur_pTC10127 [Paenarthrobacter aurescens TC1]
MASCRVGAVDETAPQQPTVTLNTASRATTAFSTIPSLDPSPRISRQRANFHHPADGPVSCSSRSASRMNRHGSDSRMDQ